MNVGTFTSRFLIPLLALSIGCAENNGSGRADDAGKGGRPVVGFVQFVEDQTVDEAKNGFYDALAEAGYSDTAGTATIIYRNAQGDFGTLSQILDYFKAQNVDIIGANTTVAMINAANKTSTIPIFMMVAPSPEIAGLTKPDSAGHPVPPANLSGAYETLAYIDTSVALIKQVLPQARTVGTIFNSSEPNSTNAMERLRTMCASLGLTLKERSVTSTNETQQAILSLIGDGIDVFFALPDNIIFGSFETIHKAATDKKIPVVTSEAGLVKRGAFIAYGADFYSWGHQAGKQAANYLKTHVLPPLELVSVRKRTYNPETAAALGLPAPEGFSPLSQQPATH
jgi:putative ABC transport system substrate-binding protein